MKIIFTFVSFMAITFTSNAKVITITCQNSPSHFLPVTINAVVGDVIHWTWVTGTHIVGPINASDIPSGAAMFNGLIDANHHTFEYVVAIAGNYHYDCHPATPHGENAYIVVTDNLGVQQNNALDKLASVYPNPSNGKFHFLIDNSQIFENSQVEIYNLQGQTIYQSAITTTKSDIDLSNQSKGLYFLVFYNRQAILTKKIVIK